MKRILVIDDDPANVSLICEMLEGRYEILTASGGKEGLSVAVQKKPDLILLDINMPDMDGFEVCARLRGQPVTSDMPVIMITTLSEVENRVRGLNLGADDYLCKPFSVGELLARINARLRRTEMGKKASEEVVAGKLRVEPSTSSVWCCDVKIKLTKTEYDLLRYLMERSGRPVDRGKILGDLWPDSVVSGRTVDTHVANIRKKIKKSGCVIEAHYKTGYVFRSGAENGKKHEK